MTALSNESIFKGMRILCSSQYYHFDVFDISDFCTWFNVTLAVLCYDTQITHKVCRWKRNAQGISKNYFLFFLTGVQACTVDVLVVRRKISQTHHLVWKSEEKSTPHLKNITMSKSMQQNLCTPSFKAMKHSHTCIQELKAKHMKLLHPDWSQTNEKCYQ